MSDYAPEQRILNMEELLSHGNIQARKAMLEILEAGLEASDPYPNTKKLVKISGDKLIVGGEEFEPAGSPKTGNEEFSLSQLGRIFVFGAGKGIQRVARAIEDALGDRLTGGHVIDKKGHPIICEKIEVTLGAHPVPDSDNVKGAERIREIAADLKENDLVFTCVGNGVSALLTLPVPGVSIDDVSITTYAMQVERGVGTGDLNMIRNSVDMMKSGRISRLFNKCMAIHILAIEPGNYNQLIHRNAWLHTLPDNNTSYKKALESLTKWDALDAVPRPIRQFLEAADPAYEPVRAEEFEKMNFRIFGVMPGYKHTAKLPPAVAKAQELGFKTMILAEDAMGVEASHAGRYIAAMTRAIERIGQPCEPPCAIFSAGEMIVTVGKERGIGGRNQEFVLSAAQGIAGSKNTLIASVDTDGTDGPGIQFSDGPDGMPRCFGGGIVDGETVTQASAMGIDLAAELKKHNTSIPLWQLKNGIETTPDISLNDLTVALVMGYAGKEGVDPWTRGL